MWPEFIPLDFFQEKVEVENITKMKVTSENPSTILNFPLMVDLNIARSEQLE